MPSLCGKEAGFGALSALLTASNSTNLVLLSGTAVFDDEDSVEIVSSTADCAICACALVGGLKLESSTTNRRVAPLGLLAQGDSRWWGSVQRTRNASSDAWKNVRLREKWSTRAFALSRIASFEAAPSCCDIA